MKKVMLGTGVVLCLAGLMFGTAIVWTSVLLGYNASLAPGDMEERFRKFREEYGSSE